MVLCMSSMLFPPVTEAAQGCTISQKLVRVGTSSQLIMKSSCLSEKKVKVPPYDVICGVHNFSCICIISDDFSGVLRD